MKNEENRNKDLWGRICRSSALWGRILPYIEWEGFVGMDSFAFWREKA